MASSGPSKLFRLDSSTVVTVKVWKEKLAVDIRCWRVEDDGTKKSDGVMLFTEQYHKMVKYGRALMNTTMDTTLSLSTDLDAEGMMNLGGTAQMCAGGSSLRVLFRKKDGQVKEITLSGRQYDQLENHGKEIEGAIQETEDWLEKSKEEDREAGGDGDFPLTQPFTVEEKPYKAKLGKKRGGK